MRAPILKVQAIRKAPKPVPLTVSRPELLRGKSDNDFRTLVHSLLAFSASLESVRDGFAGLIGLTGIQYTVLISVSHLEAEGNVGVTMLAAHLQLSGAFVTIETGKLLERGLLTKQQDRGDRRRVCLKTTAKGRGLLQSLAPTQVAVNDVLFDFLDAPGFRQVLGAMDRVASSGNRAVALLSYLSEAREQVR